ncbi:MAG: MaoC family dehydratase [Magnetospirillum sp.]|nr:MaoC family dehydratase [Magnetospirillum sp.]
MTHEAPKGLSFEELAVGQTAEMAKAVTDRDITAFAEISGDANPVHLDEDYARTTPFKGRIAHGILSAAFISAVFGTKLPGPGAIYVAQSLRFRAPVRIGDTVVARVELTGLVPDKKFATFKTTCSVGGKVVLDGEATLMVPSRG